ncbi:hypothetical protein CJ030_MR4G020996 [Morella rubra]|uniref:Uncharacterized protein n=1 Tax=Morella rubra TaxID=262757 RepID=A0A6A1VX34_9ROSI|nr:hypothetical protein CJ030_MR4G020996 [Morella rubra]
MDSQEQGDTSFIELLQGDANMDNSFLDQSQQVSMSIAHSQPQVHVDNTKKSTRGSNFSIEYALLPRMSMPALYIAITHGQSATKEN